ncbi:MAG TPA: co-chaperone GroES [Candidatus Paceibacterota bacterium]
MAKNRVKKVIKKSKKIEKIEAGVTEVDMIDGLPSLKVKPLGDRVLVEPLLADNGEATKYGIIIPETVSKERPEQGVIVAVGSGRMTDQGKLIPLKVKKGQKIIFSKYGPDEIKIEDKEYFIISESNILAIIES